MVDKSTDENKDQQYALTDAAKAYEKAGAAFQGATWVNDSQYQQSDDVLAAARALNDIVARQREEEQHAQFRTQKAAALIDLDTQIANAPDEETRNKLRDIRGKLEDAKFGDNISTIVANARGDSTKATASVDGPSAEILELVGKIKEVDKKIGKNLDELYARGLISKDEYDRLKKQEAELDKLAPGSQEWMDLNTIHQKDLEKTVDGADKRTPEGTPGKEIFTESKLYIKEREELGNNLIKQTTQEQSIRRAADSIPTESSTIAPLQPHQGLDAKTISLAESGTLASPQAPGKVGNIKLEQGF